MATVIGNLYTLDSEQLRSALDQIGPSSLASMRGLGIAASDIQSATLNRHISMMSDRTDRNALSPTSDNDEYAFTDKPVKHTEKNNPVKKPRTKHAANSSLSFFASGAGTRGKVQNSGDLPSYSFSDGGLLMGADYTISEHFTTGILGGYLYGHAETDFPRSGKVDSKNARYGIYASGYTDRFHLNLYAGRAEDFFSTNREINFADISRTATAKPRGNELNLYSHTGYDFKIGRSGKIGPTAELNYDKLNIDQFTENGADSLNLIVHSQTAYSLRSTLGVRYADTRNMGSYRIASYISAGLKHEFKTPGSIESQLASGDGTVFSVSTGDFGRNGLLAGLGIAVIWSSRTSLNFDYSGDFRSGLSAHIINTGLHFKF